MKNLHIISLGCPKNAVDSEHLGGVLEAAGFRLVGSAEEADVALVNTCGFLQAAVEEGIQVILDLERLKKAGVVRQIAVVGCMLNRYGDELKAEFPTVDFWAKSEDWGALLREMGRGVPAAAESGCLRADLAGTPWTRYLKISEGCNSRCSYCAIPGIRGRLRSVPVEQIVGEARRLVDEGAKELCLVGQELSIYGSDLFGRPSLPRLLDELEKELLAQNAEHKDWTCSEEMMKLTKDGKALYLHCLPADISGLSCPEGEVDNSVFDRYLVPLYKQASFKPYIIAAMIFLAQVKDPVKALMELDAADNKRKMF